MSVPGMMYPTQKGMIGSTPAQSAYLAGTNKAQSQTLANNLMAAGSKRRKYRGGAIAVPQMQTLYSPQGATSPNDQIKMNSSTSTQSHENAKYDNAATQMGGKKSRRKSLSKTRSKSRSKSRSRRHKHKYSRHSKKRSRRY